MKIGIISDTHGSLSAMEKAILAAGNLDAWLHLGDCIEDACYIHDITRVPVYKVVGNGDWNDREIPAELVVNLGKKKFFLTHGHLYGVKSGVDKLVEVGQENGADVIVYGHTHVFFDCEKDGMRIINPGSPTFPRGDKKNSFVILTLEGEDMQVERVFLP